MKNKLINIIVIVVGIVGAVWVNAQKQEKLPEALESLFVSEPNGSIKNSRQISFVGPRSGEGYFSSDGKQLIFQSEREPGNPFYQMYRINIDEGDKKTSEVGKVTRLSPGLGKTTCGWFHPNGKQVLFSSTHLDPSAKKKQDEEFEGRKKAVKARYSWSFDEYFDIFISDLNGKKLKQITQEKGYDAEASFSPDGKWIAFASNRRGYSDKLSEDDLKLFEKDPSYMMDIFIMKADGSGVQQLTQEKGYDGGPFFSADGKKLVWRHFNSTGTQAEIWTMNVDGSDKKQVTKLGSMSWAPFFHPSGDYIIFTSSVLGYSNFELFIVDTAGNHKPVRVSFLDGFDGLASFSPDGQRMTWAHRNEKGDSQIYLSDWDDLEARRLLDLDPVAPKLKQLSPALAEADLKKWIYYLASAKFGGRKSGSEEERQYQDHIVDIFKSMGFRGGAKDGSFFDSFTFTSGVKLGEKNSLEVLGSYVKKWVVGQDYQPLSLSKVGDFKEAPLAFVGYGIKAPGSDKDPAYDSYKDMDVSGKWVIALRDIPQNLSKERKIYLQFYSHIQHKARVAKAAGAVGLILVRGPAVEGVEKFSEKNFSDKLSLDGAKSDMELAVISMSTSAVDGLVKYAGQDFKQIQDKLDSGEWVDGFSIPSTYIKGQINLDFEKSQGRNVIAKLAMKSQGLTRRGQKNLGLLIGAHGDHLGHGENGNSLAKSEERGHVHVGADDNASGVAGVMELAHFYSDLNKKSPKVLKKDISFAIWSGEEIGVLGSTNFAQNIQKNHMNIGAYINMDMIGRLKDKILVQGVGSGDQWTKISELMAIGNPLLPLQIQEDPYLPTDSMAFYLAEVPTLNFFTGAHEDYHSPRDTAEKINYVGEVEILKLVRAFTNHLVFNHADFPKYVKTGSGPGKRLEGRSFRIYLGSIPDYSSEGIKGVKISGTAKDSPAEKAGMRPGDIIIEFDGQKIENIYDYVYSLQVAKANKETIIKISRKASTASEELQSIELKILPQLKE